MSNEEVKCKSCGESNSVDSDSAYCIYCGRPLFNMCVNDHCAINTLDDNAAFCHKCGEPSLFNEYGMVAPKTIKTDELPF